MRYTSVLDIVGDIAAARVTMEGFHGADYVDLRGANADDLYAQAQLSRGKALDKCVLYAFRCAVAYAEDPHPNPDEYRWWFFCDDGKGRSKKSYKG